VEEEQGIYREEVVLMMGALADITSTPRESSRFSKRTMTMKGKKKQTPEEWRPSREEQEARAKALYARAAKIQRELAAKRKSA
jgi:hypothetical protein